MIFWENDNSFSLTVSPLNSEPKLLKGLWLILMGVDEIPPHIALLHNGKYYSLSTRKVDCGNPFEKLLNALERKNIPALFVHIDTLMLQTPKGGLSSTTLQMAPCGKSPFRGLGQNTEAILQKFYTGLQPLGANEKTCLSPIKDFFTEYYSPEFKQVNFVFELLAIADKKGLLKETISLNTQNPDSNVLTLHKYTMAQIKNKISVVSAKILNSNT